MRLLQGLLVPAILAGVALSPGDAEAQSQLGNSVVTFDAVTSYASSPWNGANALFVTGVQHGAAGPSSLIFTGTSASPASAATWTTCEKELLVAINRPGRFSFAVIYTGGTTPPTTGTSTTTNTIYACTLTQLP